MKQTQNYHLSQWELTDRIRMGDFNGDNAKIDAALGALAATDFDRAFTVFHGIFFPGKDNWLFDPATDPVIVLLPEEFFRNCAIAIGVSLLGLCLLLLFTGRRQKK